MVETATTLTGQYGLGNADAALSRGSATVAATGTAQSSAKDAAVEFESVFLRTMLQSMFTGLEEGGTWGSGTGSDAWKGMLIDEYAKEISKAGGVGLAGSIERELLQLQEAAQ